MSLKIRLKALQAIIQNETIMSYMAQRIGGEIRKRSLLLKWDQNNRHETTTIESREVEKGDIYKFLKINWIGQTECRF